MLDVFLLVPYFAFNQGIYGDCIYVDDSQAMILGSFLNHAGFHSSCAVGPLYLWKVV